MNQNNQQYPHAGGYYQLAAGYGTIGYEPNVNTFFGQPKPDAISAVKALQKASAAGQKIYQINQANRSQILPLLKHDRETLNEITHALNAGKDVTTHTDAVSIPGGWSGFGYIITDPIVGNGSYKISGGSNGGVIALGYIINVLTFFYNFLDALSSTLSPLSKNVIGSLANIARLLTMAKFVFDVLKTGGDCLGRDVGPVFLL